MRPCATVRNISLDLSGAGHAGMRVAYSQSAAPDNEEVRSHRLEAGAAKVSGLEVGDVIAFKLFEDKTLEVTIVRETEALSGRAFLGRIDNTLDALGCVILETEAGIILDVTDFEHQRVWKVVSDENGVTVREIKPDNTRRQGSDTLYRPVGQAPVNVSVMTTNGVTSVVTNTAVSAMAPQLSSLNAVVSESVSVMTAETLAAASTETTVDVLINYDSDAAAWARSNGGGVQAFAETCVQKMNTALANTGLTSYFRFRLVGVYEVGGSAGGDLEYALFFTSGIYEGTLNGVSWDGVREKRDTLSADIVCTLCDNGSEYGTVGLGMALHEGDDSADCGFNACQIRSVANSHTMTHEVGHNMGAGHGDQQADSPGPQYYDYSSGYYFTASGTKYHTIMAYDSDGYGNSYSEVPYFSSPNYTYNGVAVGTATKNDNTRTLRENWQMVANNRKPAFISEDIGKGFEAENYVWTTDGTYPWTRVTDSSVDGVDSSRSCEMSGYSTSWTETNVNGPSTLSFQLRVRTYNGIFNVFVDGETEYEYTAIDYGNSWRTVSVSIPSGVHTVRLAYTHPGTGYVSGGNGAWIDQLAFSGGSPEIEDGDDPPVVWVDLATALDNTALTFTTGGSASWYGQTEYTSDGVDAARSGDITSDQESWMQTTVSGAGTISFKWYVSSESGYDFLEFSIDGTLQEKISGTGNSWAGKSFTISTTGSHTLKWRYVKDGSSDIGDDAGFVDRVVWAPSRTYTVKFNRTDGSGVTYTCALPVGVSSQLPTLQSMGWSYSGHYFMGWSTRVYNLALEPAPVVDFIDGAYVKDLASTGKTITLYAVWSSSPLKSIPSISSSASASTVNATVDGVGFADPNVKKMIGGSASVYSAFRTWAQSMTGGEAAVAISPHAAAAYLLGANKLLGYEPTIILDALGGADVGGSGLSVAVIVKDGERVIDVDASKVKSMFEATTNLSDWSGSSKLTTTVTVEKDEGARIKFMVLPETGSNKQMFIRIRNK